MFSRILLLVIATLCAALCIACGGAGSSTVTSSPSASVSNSSPSMPSTPSQPPEAAPPLTFEERLAKLPEAEALYARLEVEGILIDLDPRRMNVGDIGRFPNGVKVFQVVNHREFLAMFRDDVVYFCGLPTGNLVDGKSYDMQNEIFYVEGTRRYVTALGSTKQVLSVRRVNTEAAQDVIAAERSRRSAAIEEANRQKEAIEEEERRAREAVRLARQEKIEAAKWRTWTSADGAFSTEAKYVKLANGVVTLEKRDGKVINVPLEKLVPADAEFVRAQPWKKAAD